MGLYIGIDGGGTKTKCVLTDDQLRIIASAQAGPTNPLAVGINKSSEILFGLIQKVLRKANGFPISTVVIGLAGAGRKKHCEEIEVRLARLSRKKKILLNRVKVLSDIEIALEGAFAGEPGIILVAGTGSIVLGKDKRGNLFRVGGFGKIIGDEGSGYSIGRKGLQSVAKEFDGRGDKTILTDIARKKYAINNSDDLITKVHSSDFDVAGFAKYVIDAAQLGDKISRGILSHESDELICYVETLNKKIRPKKINLSLSGGLLSSRNYYSNLLCRKIKESFREFQIKKIIYPPEIGAVLLSKKIVHNQ